MPTHAEFLSLPSDPRIRAAGATAGWLHFAALAFLHRYGGRVLPRTLIAGVVTMPPGEIADSINALITVGLWAEVPEGYALAMPARDAVASAELSAKRREAGRAGGHKSGETRSKSKQTGKQIEANGEANRSTIEANRSNHEANREANRSTFEASASPEHDHAHVSRARDRKELDVNVNVTPSAPETSQSSTSVARANARPTKPPPPSPLEDLLGPEGSERAAIRYAKIDANLDAIWLTKALWAVYRANPGIDRPTLLEAITKALSSTKPDAAKSSVTAYAEAILLDRCANEVALAQRRAAKGANGAAHLGANGHGDPAATRPAGGGDGRVGVGDRAAVLRRAIAGDPAGAAGDDQRSDAGDRIRQLAARAPRPPRVQGAAG